MSESIIEGVREYMAACPHLSAIPINKRHIDWTGANPKDYGIFPDSDNPVKPFISGGGKYEYNFAVKFKLKAAEVQGLENAKFMESIQEWVRQKNAKKDFPVLPDGCSPTKLTAANAMSLDSSTGLYQIQLKLNYIRR